MKKSFILSFILITFACNEKTSEPSVKIKVPHQMKITTVFIGNFKPVVYRYENDEVICYVARYGDGAGLQCKFKNKDKQ